MRKQFQIGDRVRVLPTITRRYPNSPLPTAGILTVCAPGAYAIPGEVAVAFKGDVWYVLPSYLEKVR